MAIKERNIAICIILTIVTCGIYGLYWLYCLAEDTNVAAGEAGTSGAMVIILSIVTCSIYEYYWMYKQGEKLNVAKANRGLPTDSNSGLIYLLLTIFGLGIISYCLMQNELNKIAEA